MKSFPVLGSVIAALALVGCGSDDAKPATSKYQPKPADKPTLVVPTPPAPKLEAKLESPKPESPKPESPDAKLDGMKAPSTARELVAVARAELAGGDVAAAKRHAERATELAGDWSSAWNTLGRAELAAGAVDDAIASFEAAVEANDDNAYAWNNLGFAHMRKQAWSDAAAALEHAVEGDDAEAFMWNNLGMAYEHLNRLDAARHAYDEAATAGSALAKDNRVRLEGVHSIAGLPPPDDSGTD